MKKTPEIDSRFGDVTRKYKRLSPDAIVKIKENPPLFRARYLTTTIMPAKFVLAREIIQSGVFEEDRDFLRFLHDNFLPNKTLIEGNGIKPEDKQLWEEMGGEAKSRITMMLMEKGVIDPDSADGKRAQESFRDSVEELGEEGNISSEQFKRYVSFFGASSAVDILYATRPEFKGIPIDYLNSTIADYLGNYLLQAGGFDFIDADPEGFGEAIKLLSNPNLQQGLYQVLKENAMTYLNNQRRETHSMDDQGIVKQYFEQLAEFEKQMGDPLFLRVVERTAEYYDKVFHAITKPICLVDQLRAGRAFPDTNQRINALESAENTRQLIADRMGLGKSASFIFTWEFIKEKKREQGDKTGPAFITAPADVISTWKTYLSSEVGKNGEQLGYFKKGFEPKVYVIDSSNGLDTIDFDQYDYVLGTHQRFNQGFVDKLLKKGIEGVCVDEIHRFKNVEYGTRAEALMELSRGMEGKHFVMLSGTPAPNRVKDIAIVLKLLYPDRFGNTSGKDLVKAILKGDLINLRALLLPRMQMKDLKDSIEMPELSENEVYVELSELESDIYQVILENDDLSALEKIMILRKFCLNSSMCEAVPEIEVSKVRKLNEDIRRKFEHSDRQLVFVNDYIEGILRGKGNMVDALDLPKDVETYVIHGDTPYEERDRIQKLFNERTSGKKMILFVSGGTGAVGRSFVGGDHVDFYNEPWTHSDKDQQLGRVYREKLDHPLSSDTYITKGTIEAGINEWIKIKDKAIQKLFLGIPITELEKEMLEREGEEVDTSLEVNPELAKYYFSSVDRMFAIFSRVKQIGESKFADFLQKYSSDYAECYTDLGVRSYQANAARVSGTVIARLIDKNGEKVAPGFRVLDLASGPRMLANHAPEDWQHTVQSLDINPKHFIRNSERSVVGSMVRVPFKDGSFDYVNLGLALHYTRFIPSKNVYERMELLQEINRVLKPGGTAVLNLIYSLDLKNYSQFVDLVNVLGFDVDSEYSGTVDQTGQYKSRVVTLKKRELKEGLQEEDVRGYYDGLKMVKTNITLRDSRKMLEEFALNGETIQVTYNGEDRKVLEEERRIFELGERLKSQYGSIEAIPREEIIQNNFVRVFIGNRYILFTKISTENGIILIK